MPPLRPLGERVIVAEIGMEGGGVTIFGNRSERGWTFWTEGRSIDLDENGEEVWHSWSSEPVSDLDLVLPRDWPIFDPSTIHPDLSDWFRANYDTAPSVAARGSAALPGKHRHAHG